MKYAMALIMCVAFVPSVRAGTCTFVTECFETESCSETEYAVDIAAGPNGPDHVQLVTPSETLDATLAGSMDLGLLMAMGETALHVISTSTSGDARYSVHMAGPMLVTYHGICEVND